jgi:hypothetical protein
MEGADMSLHGFRLAGYALMFFAIGRDAVAQIEAKTFPVSRESLCVTEGAVENTPENQLQVRSEKMRAYVNAWTAQALETNFTYLGNTPEVSELKSGAIRLQFGLELQAHDPCNLVYAMWRFAPDAGVVVSVKRNLGMTKSSECGNSGYVNIKPVRSAPVPKLQKGDSHTLCAEMVGGQLRVFVDKTEVWAGSLGPETADLKGPVGIRSDNVQLTFDLNAGVLAGQHPQYLHACRTDGNAPD